MGVRGQPWGWVATEEARDDRRRHACRLVGCRLRAVRYVHIDNERDRWAAGFDGPRPIEAPAEWLSPPWRYEDLDSVDFGVELETTDGRRFTVTWDMPGDEESIGIREIPALGFACSEDRDDLAVWDVTTRGRWHRYLRRDITDVVLHYQPWDEEGGFWCRRITVRFGAAAVDFVLAESTTGILQRAVDSVAVVFSPYALPPWLEPGC